MCLQVLAFKTFGFGTYSDVFGDACFPVISRSDEYGEGPKGRASTGEEGEMGVEAKGAEKPIELSSKVRCTGWPI